MESARLHLPGWGAAKVNVVLRSLGLKGLAIAVLLVLWGSWYGQRKVARKVGLHYRITRTIAQ